MRSFLRWGGLIAAATVGSALAERPALACGGCFHDPNEIDSVITDHRMILSVSPQQTTLYDEIEFQGAASSFAWVLPIKGAATVGLSADIVFGALDQLTASQVVPPPADCAPPPACLGLRTGGADAGAAGPGSVVVTSQMQVGPYETVQLQSSDPTALQNWLTAHGYAIPASAAPVVAAYVADGFDFLAMKLAPGEGVRAMRPVRVTTEGASPVLPLRMVAVGTGATTGITLWVIADGRWEPQNFPFFTIADSELVWDWATDSSNYEKLRLSKEAALGGRGWQVESSLELSQSLVTNFVLTGQQFGGLEQPADADYLATGDDASDGGSLDGGDAAAGETAEQVRDDDLATLFSGIVAPNARITRIRSDIAQAALTVDLTLQASADQTELNNVHSTTGAVGSPQCPTYGTCPDAGDTSDAGSGSGRGVDAGTGNGTGKGTGAGQQGSGRGGADVGSGAPSSTGGCETTASTGGSWALPLTLLAFVGSGLRWSRRRKQRRG